MTDKDTKNKESCSTEECSPCEKGTSNLLFGAGVGAYGTASFLATGAVCPACIILAPALLGLGAYKRMKYNQKQDDGI